MYLDLTTKQISILEFIKKELKLKNYPPSVREICVAVGLKSSSSVHSHLNKLEKLGYITKDPSIPRAIGIVEKDNHETLNNEIIHLPVLGKVTAGQPIFAEENIEEYLPLPANFVIGKDNFILRVKGNSMENCGILDKDYVVVDKSNTANSNQIVVALIDNEAATIKRFFREEDHVRLQPENDFMEPIILDINRVSIIGHVKGVFRVIK